MRNIFWFRRDLRLEDNIGLYYALMQSNEVIPVFIIDTNFLNSSDIGDAKIYFLFDSIKELDRELKELNSKLIIRSGNPANELIKLARETNAQGIYFNENYEPFELSRDKKVTEVFTKSGLKISKYKDQIIFDNEIPVFTKKSITNFAAYKKKWLGKLRPEHYKLTINTNKDLLKLIGPDWEIYSLSHPNPKDYNFNLDTVYWKGGEIQAKKIAAEFFKEGIFNDKKPDCLINRDGLFNITPYLRFGNFSVRKFLNQLMSVWNDQPICDKWLEKIIKTDYYTQLLFASGNQKDEKEKLNPGWANNYQHFFSWCKGLTGYPIIDAAINQLNKESWLPEILKELIASFLVKNLKLDWKWGEKYFMHKLVDGDLVNNSAEWKNIFSAKAGMFDPVSAGKAIDKSGEYIKRFLPQLKDVPEIYIHEPYKMPVSLQRKLSCIIGSDYPEPVIKLEKIKSKSIYLHKTAD